METIRTCYTGDLRTEAGHVLSGSRLTTDAPPDNQGKGEAFSPTDLLAASLCSCMLTIMGIAAREHGFSIDGTLGKTWKTMASEPRRVGEIRIELRFPHNRYTVKEKTIIERSAFTCPVFMSLHPDLKKTISFIYPRLSVTQ
ncbi:MAG: OsmC family protein [Bacteroidales bacterium]|nr:OsmC family protein [Bacteroidales bacterium]